jgi:hypothetical protein
MFANAVVMAHDDMPVMYEMFVVCWMLDDDGFRKGWGRN